MPNHYPFKDFAGSSHRILIDLVRRHAKAGGTLLDLGAAGGELGSALRDRFRKTIGFEYNVDCIGELKHRFDQVAVTDLDVVTKLPAAVDAIVMADVLEHLHDPAAALRLVRRSLADEGMAFISVPNVANVTVRLALLFGQFEYAERGILDRTHIRFFTPTSFRREVEAAGFRIVESTASTMPIRIVLAGRIPEWLLRLAERMLIPLTRIWRSLFAYQIIVVASKR
jgi:2-polyprenyl-3-methyl-5-hydroxy-6-metoxy-1,4-benzoquinol methylase